MSSSKSIQFAIAATCGSFKTPAAHALQSSNTRTEINSLQSQISTQKLTIATELCILHIKAIMTHTLEETEAALCNALETIAKAAVLNHNSQCTRTACVAGRYL
ncbi:hypothetical protein M758_9G006100 [Ceratodon purpureus]|nr:hypothetical protein M758_9G006100 [Ceratodon purpureus]